MSRAIAWLAALQACAVLLGHAAGIMGESWVEKVFEVDASLAPSLTRFYAHQGLWLLLLPILWLTGYMVWSSSPSRTPRLIVWVLTGFILLTVLGAAAVMAMLVPFTSGTQQMS